MDLDQDPHDLIGLHNGMYDLMDLDHDLYDIMDLGHDLPEVVNKKSRNDRIVVRIQRVLYGCAFFACVCTIDLPLLLQATPSSTHCSVRRRDASSCERERELYHCWSYRSFFLHRELFTKCPYQSCFLRRGLFTISVGVHTYPASYI